MSDFVVQVVDSIDFFLGNTFWHGLIQQDMYNPYGKGTYVRNSLLLSSIDPLVLVVVTVLSSTVAPDAHLSSINERYECVFQFICMCICIRLDPKLYLNKQLK